MPSTSRIRVMRMAMLQLETATSGGSPPLVVRQGIFSSDLRSLSEPAGLRRGTFLSHAISFNKAIKSAKYDPLIRPGDSGVWIWPGGGGSMRLIPKFLKTPVPVLLILGSIFLGRITAIDKVHAIATDTGETEKHNKTAPIKNAQEFKNTRELIQYLVRAAGSNANSPFNPKLALNG